MLTQTLQPRSTQARDRVLEAACHLFATHGYQAIGLRDLAKHLGMQAGSLYHHIESKQSLLFELIECSLTDLIYETRQAIKRSRTPAERLQTFVQAFVSFSQENPDHLILMTREAVNLDDDQSRQIQGLQATYTELLANIVADECGVPSCHSRVVSIAHAVICMLCGQAHWSTPRSAPSSLPQMLVGFVRGIVGTGRPGAQMEQSVYAVAHR
ncbi:TetR/AcrR family transcriptional regulator [Pseudomonas putida]|uniref:TetR/AcrR family transcriptional regulator n=1 Tax=Pseudomonas putida TaxID=303 RepID=A0A7D5VWS1_PSEPU|nr:TetR/AcrR family transcriptional regulator [Pseudomonas putida]QLJ12574.1 TetR/AcrR family transcriptional regulator [Pseudomonas putida]